ncbi:MAG TPA: hypothetical protein VF174_08040 [Micromonosporaceae bacterium]
MVDRTSSATPVQLTPGCRRIPDGHIVPNPRPAPAEPDRRLHYTIIACVIVVLAVITAAPLLR